MNSHAAGEGINHGAARLNPHAYDPGFRLILAAQDSSSPRWRELAGALAIEWPTKLARPKDVLVRSYATLRVDCLDAGEILASDVVLACDSDDTPEHRQAAHDALRAAAARGAAILRLAPNPAPGCEPQYTPDSADARSDLNACDQPAPISVDPALGTAVLAGLVVGIASRQAALAALEREARACSRASEALAESLERLNADLTLAASVQRECMASAAPAAGCVRTAAVYRPSGGVCGDVYELHRLDEHRIAFLVADVSGHGLAAGLMAMVVAKAACFRDSGTRAGEPLAPDETLRRLNLLFLRSRGESALLATALCGIADARDRSVRIASAGHPPALRIAEGIVSLVRCPGSGAPLGVSPSSTYHSDRITLRDGEVLLAYTDGLEGALSPRSREGAIDRVGDERDLAQRLMRVCPLLRPDTLAESLAQLERALSEQNGSLHQEDDLTLVALGITHADRPSPLEEARLLARRLKDESLDALHRATATIRGS